MTHSLWLWLPAQKNCSISDIYHSYIFPFESVCQTLPLLDLLIHPTKEQHGWSDASVKQSAVYLSVPASDKVDIIESVSTKLAYTLSPPCAYVFGWAIVDALRALLMSCIWHLCSFYFLWLPFSPFFACITDLPCIAVSWQGSGGLEPGNWVFVRV